MPLRQLHEDPGLPLDIIIPRGPGAGLHRHVHSEHGVHDGAFINLKIKTIADKAAFQLQ